MITLCGLLWPTGQVLAQGVTTGQISGVVTDAKQQPIAGASVIAIHEPSGTSYEATSRADGRFFVPNMRVGGPYTVMVTYVGAGTAFEPQTQQDVMVNLGVATDLPITVRAISVQETVTVTAQSDTVFSSARTGAATSVSRAELATIPTVSGRINDITRLTPQASGMSFGGQDNRLNNITVDGSYFNNSFGLAGAPGERTGVAPISLEAIEQVQVNVAPFDVRQGNFVGAGVNTVTRSGTNRLTGSVFHRFRNNDFVGTEAAGLPFNPGLFNFRNTGGWVSGPIIKNRLFAFGNYENERDSRPLTTFTANAGGETVGGQKTRVLSSDLAQISALLAQRFQYETGPFENYDDLTPVKRFLLRNDVNLGNNNKVSFRYNHLDSSTDVGISGSTSAGFGRGSGTTNFLSFQNSNYQILENIRSGIGEWNSILGSSMSNSLIIGYTKQDESRASRGSVFPLVDIFESGQSYTSFGSEPFTPNNELRYNTFQLQDNFTRFGNKHSLTFGVSLERYESANVFFPVSQSAYVYNSLNDFYTDANDFAANPNRTVSPVTLRLFQVRYINIPGLDKPVQPLEVLYGGAYAQDEWRPNSRMTVTAGLRLDVPKFGETGFANSNADSLTFRDENGQGVQYSTGALPDPTILWSPRVGLNWDVFGTQRTQVRGGTGIFTGRPAYVWISNQIGNTGVLTGFEEVGRVGGTTTRPFSPDPNRYKPANVTGAPAPSYELALTDPDFKFPQIWRSNVAVDHRLPWKITATGEFLYNKDVNGVYYINANLPEAQTTFAGVDNRPRWTNNRIHANIPNATVLKNQSVGSSWNLAGTLAKTTTFGLAMRGAYSYNRSRNTVDPGSVAFGSWSSNPHSGDPNNPGVANSTPFGGSLGHRVFALVSYNKRWARFGGTSISMFYEGRNNGNTHYTFATDMNRDGGSGNDLVYIHRDVSEMNFVEFRHTNGRVFSPAEQAQAWNAFIEQDEYLRKRRGQYAERGAVLLPLVHRADLSVTQDIFANIAGRRNGFQVRADIQNFGNLLNSDWGVGQRLIRNQVLTNPGVDAEGRPTYRMVVVNNELLTRSLETTTFSSDVFSFLISLRYTFN
ncbi:MAG TPA: carboxypeptidase regulatory-like domain-containing protein [Vicinamibacterales bacterium]|nr:carboxypeptidase regulatory-like domain-containing protein [Vicinamibacterales bacterium]